MSSSTIANDSINDAKSFRSRRLRSKNSQVVVDQSTLELSPQLKIRRILLAIITGVLPDDLKNDALKLVIETLRVADDDIRGLAVIGLHEIGVGSPQALDVFVDVLNDPSLLVRRRAVRAIGDFGAAASHCVRELVTMTHDTDYSVRIEAINSLGKLGAAAKSAIPAIVALLGDEDTRIRTISGLAIRKIGHHSVPHLVGLLSDPSAISRERAASLLGRFGFCNDAILQALLEASQDEDSDVRSAARCSLETLEVPVMS
jgi:HEAT repeat protein